MDFSEVVVEVMDRDFGIRVSMKRKVDLLKNAPKAHSNQSLSLISAVTQAFYKGCTLDLIIKRQTAITSSSITLTESKKVIVPNKPEQQLGGGYHLVGNASGNAYRSLTLMDTQRRSLGITSMIMCRRKQLTGRFLRL